MKPYCIYDSGSGPEREDGLIMGVNTFGVLDGTSAPHGPSYPKKFYDGLTGGELMARTTEGALLGSSWKLSSLQKILALLIPWLGTGSMTTTNFPGI